MISVPDRQSSPLPPAELFRQPPAFATAAEERRHRQERLAAVLRLFGRLGYEEGLAGHVTVRDPEEDDTYWANPLGVPFAHVTVDDLVRIDGSGRILAGHHRVNLGAFNIHAAVHRARPDVVAVVHTHSVYGRAFSALHRLLAPITQDACPFFEDHHLFDQYGGIVLDGQDGPRMAQTLGRAKALILANHGLLTVGASVDAAAWWFVAMERCCQVQLAAEAAGPVHTIPDEVARLTRAQIGSHLVAWNSFQPLYEQIVRSDPDLFAAPPGARPGAA